MYLDKSVIKKILNATRFLILALPLGAFYWHGFVVNENIEIYISLASILVSLWVYYIHVLAYRTGAWKPNNNLAKPIKIISHIVIVPVIFIVSWLSCGISLPALYASLLGVEGYEKINLIKDVHYSYRSCKYRMEISNRSLSQSAFYFCISEDQYRLLPSKSEYYRANVLASPVGYIVQGVEFE
jgi:hypothetical protein